MTEDGYRYQETGEYFAQIAGGSEELGAEELEELGATRTLPVYRGIRFHADAESLYRINYCSRTITRVLAPLDRFTCHNPDYLYRRALAMEWSEFMSVDQTFAIFSNVANSSIRHSKYLALRLKDAIVDYFRERTGDRPSINRHNPDVWFHVDLHDNIATISLETTGGSLHRRGYRKSGGAAPIQETTAAAIIRMTGWDGSKPLVDPMCGSGTLLAEAVMSYCKIPSAFLRSTFGVKALPDFDSKLWDKLKAETDSSIKPLPKDLIHGGDIDTVAIESSRRNLSALPGGENVDLQVKNWRSIESISNAVLVTNPPYGMRINSREPIDEFYKGFGDFLKQKCTGCEAYLYTGDRSLLKKVGLRTTWKKELVNGSLDGRLAKYDLYKGSAQLDSPK